MHMLCAKDGVAKLATKVRKMEVNEREERGERRRVLCQLQFAANRVILRSFSERMITLVTSVFSLFTQSRRISISYLFIKLVSSDLLFLFYLLSCSLF